MEKVFASILEKAKAYCRKETDLTHIISALKMAKKLIHLEGGNERIIIPAIILHDTGWHNFSEDEELKVRKGWMKLEDAILNHRHEVESSLIAQNVLSEINYPEEDKNQIIEIIIGHDTRSKAISKEDGIVKDADRLSRYTPECFNLFSAKLKVNEEGFFILLNSNLERWFFTESAKILAREYLLKRKLGIPEMEFPEGLPKNLYEILIRLEGEVAKKLKVNLEGLAINAVCEKVSDVVRMIKIYLSGRENIDVSALQKDEKFQAIATQRVGEGGYIGIIERQTGKIIFHPDKRLINLSPEELKKQYRPPDFLHGFWEWHKRARNVEEFYSYYQGINTKQEIIDKFHYVKPLDIKNIKWAVTAVADCKDFFKPMDILSEEIIQYVRDTSFQIGELANLANRQAKEIQEEKERLNVTLRSIGDGVIVADTEGRVVLLNKVAEELTGWKEEEAMNKPAGEVFHIINEYTRRRCENPVRKVLESGLIVGLANHTVLIARDGRERVIADSGAPIYGQDGKVMGVVLVFRDITEKRRSEERLIQAEKLSAVVQIASEATHEIRNPIGVIKAGLYYLKRILPKEEENARRKLYQMDKATERVSSCVDDLLNFSKPPILKLKPLKVNEVLEESLEELSPEMLPDIKLDKDFEVDLPQINADYQRLKQVFLNIIKNACEAMGEEEIRRPAKAGALRLEVRSKRENDFIKIEIYNSGKEISEENLKHIFDPFFTTKGKGTGLGLSICQRIIEAHKGGIEVVSKVGAGTTFIITLPKAGVPDSSGAITKQPSIN